MSDTTPRRTVYLAGPDVFFPDAEGHAAMKRALCHEYGFIGHTPLDTKVEASETTTLAESIYDANLAAMQAADLCIANLTPYRGPSADAGTIFEVGWFIGAGKPVFGYSNAMRSFEQRTREYLTRNRDPVGFVIESFDLMDNLMIPLSIIRSAKGSVVRPHDRDRRFDDLGTFATALLMASGRAADLDP